VRADRLLLLGKIVGLSGVQGAVKLESYTEPRMRLFAYQPWRLKHGGAERDLAGVQGREQGKGIVATLPGVADRDAAARLVGAEIWVARSALPEPKRGEFYWTDLEGLHVITLQGVPLGKVSHLFSTGANDVLVVRDGERERMIPLVFEQFVSEIDLDASKIIVDWDPDF
jgi:16S rRNA processing protein RimM